MLGCQETSMDLSSKYRGGGGGGDRGGSEDQSDLN